MFCPKCGSQNDDNAFKCVKCGLVLRISPSTRPVKKTNPGWLIAIVAAVVMIPVIGILAAIAIPAYIGVQAKAGNQLAYTELQKACTKASELFVENPNKIVTIEDFKKENIGSNPDINLSVTDGTKENLMLVAKHKNGTKTYAVNNDCRVSEKISGNKKCGE